MGGSGFWPLAIWYAEAGFHPARITTNPKPRQFKQQRILILHARGGVPAEGSGAEPQPPEALTAKHKRIFLLCANCEGNAGAPPPDPRQGASAPWIPIVAMVIAVRVARVSMVKIRLK